MDEKQDGVCTIPSSVQSVASMCQNASHDVDLITQVKARDLDHDDTIMMDLVDSDANSDLGVLHRGWTLRIKSKVTKIKDVIVEDDDEIKDVSTCVNPPSSLFPPKDVQTE